MLSSIALLGRAGAVVTHAPARLKRAGAADRGVGSMTPFEVVEAGSFGPGEPLGEGECSLSRNGTMVLRTEDLELVGIGAYAIVLADCENLRLGLRAVRDGEQQSSVACSVIRRKNSDDTGRRRIQITRALRRLGLTAEAVAGRYSLQVHRDELLFITLAAGKDRPQREAQGGKVNKRR